MFFLCFGSSLATPNGQSPTARVSLDRTNNLLIAPSSQRDVFLNNLSLSSILQQLESTQTACSYAQAQLSRQQIEIASMLLTDAQAQAQLDSAETMVNDLFASMNGLSCSLSNTPVVLADNAISHATFTSRGDVFLAIAAGPSDRSDYLDSYEFTLPNDKPVPVSSC
eukprot:m.238743 g.238743  ORF g.238743 m.238743 type:complete len:167 (+) comp54362_c0_seq4:73-573(+)